MPRRNSGTQNNCGIITATGVKLGLSQWQRDNFYLYGVVEPLTGYSFSTIFPTSMVTVFNGFRVAFCGTRQWYCGYPVRPRVISELKLSIAQTILSRFFNRLTLLNSIRLSGFGSFLQTTVGKLPNSCTTAAVGWCARSNYTWTDCFSHFLRLHPEALFSAAS